MLIIGENINASNKSVGQAISDKDLGFLENLTREIDAAGADFIDVNAGVGHGVWEHPEDAMMWLVEVVQSVTDKPLTIDSDTPSVIEAAMTGYRGGKVMINSVNAEPERLKSIGSLAAEHQAYLVALVMGTEGIPDSVEERLTAADYIISNLAQLGVKEEQVLFDPLVLPVSVDTTQAIVTLKTIEGIKARYPSARTVMGLSNISFGLPKRDMINRAFLLMAAGVGLDAAIMNPLDTKIMSYVKVADMLTGNDPVCKNYIRAHRKGLLIE